MQPNNNNNTEGSCESSGPGNRVYPITDSDDNPQLSNGVVEEQDGQENGESEEEEQQQQMVSVKEVFRFADTKDIILMIMGLICSCLNGAAMPMMIVVFGEMSDLFINSGIFKNYVNFYWDNITVICPTFTRDQILGDPSGTLIPCLMLNNQTEIIDAITENLTDDFMKQMEKYAVYFTILGVIVWVLSYIQIACWQTSSYRQCQTIRTELFRAILRQEISWFDTHESGELNTRLSDDVTKVQEGIGEKLASGLQFCATFCTGFIVGFVYGWKLTLVILAVSPLIMISGGIMAQMGTVLTSKELKAYAQAGAVAEEVFSCLRTVVAFGGQSKASMHYNQELYTARSFGLKKGVINGIGMGLVYFITFGSFGLAFWYGSQLFIKENFSAGNILVVFFGVLMGAFSLGNAAPSIERFSKARGAAYALYEIIDWDPAIDSSSTEGIKPADLSGNIEFKDVVFKYPARPDTTVLDGLSMSVNVGETVALVGASGCGKSTTVQLLQRFYDVISGKVMIDGHDIKDYNLKWLRQHIGVVSQEPVLFQTTIEENIRYGKDGATQQQIERAARMANAHDFISKLPDKYNTLVGERGAHLSGGQKQRIAIARALVSDPKILLLDEATSALDTESEAVVQAALDKASEGRTTIVIAHRLSTVRNADKIIGINSGKVAEEGNHTELMKVEGIYYTLCTNQTLEGDEDDDLHEDGKDFMHSYSVQSAVVTHRKSSILRHRIDSVMSTIKIVQHKEQHKSEEDNEEEEEDLPPVSTTRIIRLNSPEWPFIVIGCIAAILCGCVQPAFAIVFAEILGAFSNIDEDELIKETNLYSVGFVLIGAVNGLAMFIQSSSFARSGEYLTMRLRQQTFDAYLRQEVAFYDDPKNNTGALCTRLATDSSAVQGATGVRLGTILQGLSSIGFGLTIGFVYSWELSLLIIAFAPLMMIAGYVQMQVFSGNTGKDQDKLEEAGKVAIEAIENIRTVATLIKEDKFHHDYFELTSFPTKSNIQKAQVQGAVFGFSQGIIFFAFAVCFLMGAYLVENRGLSYEDMFKVFEAIVFSAQAVGESNSFAPDYGKAMTAAARLFALHDRVPCIDSSSHDGQKLQKVDGNVDLQGVTFHYPSRPDISVLQNISLEVLQGKLVALVGSSGCGKSTIIQMIERFYDPLQGTTNLEKQDIRGLNIQWLRSQMGIVSQEPVLFDCSIKDNIAYGDNGRDVSMDEIIAAARNANIHNFIQTLPDGYDTNVGDKGTQLSGGQKQRVAIARALVRNPKILLLDEATSALDTESEKVVQEALDKAQEGRTSIVIAHRLSTIQNADCILVIDKGQVVESGPHSQLLANKGIYYRLNNAQKKI